MSRIGAGLFICGMLGIVLSMVILLLPLLWGVLRGTRPGWFDILITTNELLGHARVEEAAEMVFPDWKSPRRWFRSLVYAEIALVVSFVPLVALMP